MEHARFEKYQQLGDKIDGVYSKIMNKEIKT
jgi:hypothetical protein